MSVDGHTTGFGCGHRNGGAFYEVLRRFVFEIDIETNLFCAIAWAGESPFEGFASGQSWKFIYKEVARETVSAVTNFVWSAIVIITLDFKLFSIYDSEMNIESLENNFSFDVVFSNDRIRSEWCCENLSWAEQKNQT